MSLETVSVRRLTSRPALWVAAVALVMVAVDLGRGVLSTNDEARFAVLGQDLLARGDWFFPRINGAIYHNKPPLLAWLIALVSWPVGHVTQLTAVLPSAAAAIATALVVYALGKSLFGTDGGRAAALVAVTTQGFFLHARLPLPDMLMTCFITAGLAMFWPMTRGRPGPWWIGFYGLTAAAFWAKGPAGLLPLAVALTCLLACRREGGWRQLHLLPGLALLVALTAPWWVRELMSDHTVVRQVLLSDYLFWYLPRRPSLASLVAPVQHTFGILFPWVLVVPAAVTQAVKLVRGRGTERQAVLFLILWAAVLLVFVSISQQQRLRYYLPLVPPLSLLIGWWFAGAAVAHRPVSRIPWRVYGATGAALVALTGAFLAFRERWPKDLQVAVPSSVLEVLLLVGSLAVMVAVLVHGARHDRLARALPVAVLAGAVLVATSYHGEVARRNHAHDYLRLQAEIHRQLADVSVVAAWGAQELPLTFYFKRPVVAVETSGEFRRTLAGDPRSVAILSDSAAARLEDRARFQVLLRDRLAFRPISVVSYSPDR